MKLWQKICISSLLFFLIIYFCSCVLIIEKNVKDNFDLTLRRAADEQASISAGMTRYAEQNSGRDIEGGDLYQVYMKEYLGNRINSQGIYLEVLEGDIPIYSNFDELFQEEVRDFRDYYAVTQYKILTFGEKRYLRLTNTVPYGNHEFWNTYLIDITEIYTNRSTQYLFFIKLSFVVSVVLIVGMYVISNQLMKSVRKLTQSVRRIEKGNYQERVQIRSTDEIGELAESYNNMALAIEETILRLQVKAEEQQRFIDNFTHELRTPLTAVIGYADLIRSTSGDEEYFQEMGERVFREGKRIENLAELMMNLVFLENHNFQLKPENIGDILSETEITLQPIFQQAHMTLSIKLPELSLMVLAEKDLLLNLFYNLADNAKKASQEGDTIWIRAEEADGGIVVEFEDEGIGISEEEQPKVFETFYMVDKVRNKKNGGVGLGLSICADIARIHNAKMELMSSKGQGTKIKIIFPCYKPVTNHG